MKCHICDKFGHVVTTNSIGRPDVQYYACKKFVEMTPEDRRKILFNRKFCAQCLEPGVRFGEKHNCSKEFACPDSYHRKFQSGLHVLVCGSHRESRENQRLVEEFKKYVVDKVSNLDDFSKNISICHSRTAGNMVSFKYQKTASLKGGASKNEFKVCDHAIFMLQTIKVNGRSLNLFFDSGCGDMVIKRSAIVHLRKVGRAKLELPGPIELVGEQKSTCKYGAYSVRLPLKKWTCSCIKWSLSKKSHSDFSNLPAEASDARLQGYVPGTRGGGGCTE